MIQVFSDSVGRNKLGHFLLVLCFSFNLFAAHTTQFTEIGWNYLTHNSGVGLLDYGGSYVSLLSPDRKNFTMVIETMVGFFGFSHSILSLELHFYIAVVAQEVQSRSIVYVNLTKFKYQIHKIQRPVLLL